jgi:hypothetical protein
MLISHSVRPAGRNCIGASGCCGCSLLSLPATAGRRPGARADAGLLAAAPRQGEAAAEYMELLSASPGDPTLQAALSACQDGA